VVSRDPREVQKKARQLQNSPAGVGSSELPAQLRRKTAI